MNSKLILNQQSRNLWRYLFRQKSTHKVVGTFGDTTQVTAEDRVFLKINPSQPTTEQKPLVIIFGWAGASPKNLSKYGKVYADLGCPTIEYILPTRFIFRHSEQAFEAVSSVWKEVEQSSHRKKIVHCLSDTGVMSFQGLCIASQMKDNNFKPDGIVWDSCPGPRPDVTLPRMTVLTLINWLSRMRDGMSLSQAVSSSWIDFRDLGWKNFLRKRKGLEVEISMMDDIWAGFWARDLQLDVPELFIYSKTDLYVKGAHLENNVIPFRKKISKDVTLCKFERSPHVGHLRSHPDVYKRCIQDLVAKVEKR